MSVDIYQGFVFASCVVWPHLYICKWGKCQSPLCNFLWNWREAMCIQTRITSAALMNPDLLSVEGVHGNHLTEHFPGWPKSTFESALQQDLHLLRIFCVPGKDILRTPPMTLYANYSFTYLFTSLQAGTLSSLYPWYLIELFLACWTNL